MFNICFREYDRDGNLTELVSCKSKTVKSRWKSIQKFLKSCKEGRVREVQFSHNGKQHPSLISDGEQIRFAKPIVAMLPLFEYAESKGLDV